MNKEYIAIEGRELYPEEMLYAKELDGKALNIVLLDGQGQDEQNKVVYCKAKDLWDKLPGNKIDDAPVKGQFARLEEYIINLAQVASIDVKKHEMTLAFARFDLEHVKLSFANDRGFRAIAKAIKENKEIINHQVDENYRCQTELNKHYERS